MESQLELLNVKASCTIPHTTLHFISRCCRALKIPFVQYANFIVVYEEQTTITIFKKREFSKKNRSINFKEHRQHCNFYKIKRCDELPVIRKKLSVLLNIKLHNISPIVVDNTTYILRLNKKISLKDFIRENNELDWNFPAEKFPGLFIKFPECTFIIFGSGTIVIVGAKSQADAIKYVSFIQKRLLRCSSSSYR